MAIPSIPTAASLVIEGLRQARIFYPTASQIATYQNEVMEQLKNDLWQSIKQAKPLMAFSYLVLNPGQSRYSYPSDFATDMSMTLLTGSTTGPVISATVGTLRISAAAGALDPNSTIGKDAAIIGGTALSSVCQVTGVLDNGDGTSTLTVHPNFQTTPDGSSTFMLIDNQYPVESDHIANFDKFRSAEMRRPVKFFSMGGEGSDEFLFDSSPDAGSTYVARMRYFVNIMTLDLASAHMSILYQKFREYWIKGIKAQALSDNDDDGKDAALQERNMKLQELIMSQQYGVDIHSLSQHVSDYA